MISAKANSTVFLSDTAPVKGYRTVATSSTTTLVCSTLTPAASAAAASAVPIFNWAKGLFRTTGLLKGPVTLKPFSTA